MAYYFRVSPYDNRLTHLMHDEDSIVQLAGMYDQLIFFEAEVVCT